MNTSPVKTAVPVAEPSWTAHNVAIHEGSAAGTAVFTGEVFNGVDAKVYDVDPIPAGTYTFICSVHPSMTGTANIQ